MFVYHTTSKVHKSKRKLSKMIRNALSQVLRRQNRDCWTKLKMSCSSGSDKGQQPLFKIYTKTGDKGTSATIAGDRRPKDDNIFEALGATDELTSSLGLAREFCQDAKLDLEDQLVKIQCVIQDAGSTIATPRSKASPNQIKVTEFDGFIIQELEQWIDSYTSDLPPLKNFILPGGGKASSSLHVARSICRRAERRVSPLVRDEDINPEVGRFLNRLSDYLFTVARYAALKEGKEETIYRRVKNSRKKDA